MRQMVNRDTQHDTQVMQPHLFLQGFRVDTTALRCWTLVKSQIEELGVGVFKQDSVPFHITLMTQEWLTKKFQDQNWLTPNLTPLECCI
uniref:Uncharacterized protein n=1 Tax=Octopus bimaculoides TaxID=37653 RepID=A0A0L8HJ88_OCTBM